MLEGKEITVKDKDTSGFYKYDGEKLSYAPNTVVNKDYTLRRGMKNTLPKDGWYWFESREEALDYWDLEEEFDERSLNLIKNLLEIGHVEYAKRILDDSRTKEVRKAISKE